MKISEVIKLLNRFKKDWGDLEVMSRDRQWLYSIEIVNFSAENSEIQLDFTAGSKKE